MRRDLNPAVKPGPNAAAKRYGIIISVWVRFLPAYGRRYPVLKSLQMDAFEATKRAALGERNAAAEYPRLKVVRIELMDLPR